MEIKTLDQRINEAKQASHYFDGDNLYEIDNCYEEEDKPCFRVLDTKGSNEHVIAFCDIPSKAYFMKLVRI